MIRFRLIPVLLAGAAVGAACSKDALQTITAPTAGSYVKFFNFAVNGPQVNFFLNDAKVTAISSSTCNPIPAVPDPRCTTTGAESGTGTGYGSAGNAGLYSTLAAGAYSATARIATTADNNVTIATVPVTLADGKYYSVYASGIYNTTTKASDGFAVEDAFSTTLDFTQSYVRFVNASSNSNPMTLYAKNSVSGDSVLVGSNIAYKSAGTFVPLPGAVYNLTARYAGSNTAIIARTGVSFSTAHAYTISARGDVNTASTLALDNTANR